MTAETKSTLKFCRCCGTKAYGRKRVCNRCGVPAIWDKANAEQIADQQAHAAEMEALIERLVLSA